MAGHPLHALIIMPDEKVRGDVRKGLGDHPEIKVAGEFDTWEAARSFAQKHMPDVIFADPAAGRKEALGWVDEVPNATMVVLLASNARQAALAYEKRVIDYLVRPFPSHRLEVTVERLVEWKYLRTRQTRGARVDRRIMIHSRRESAVIRAQSIVCVQAEGNYTRVLLQGSEHKLVHRSLRQWKRLLPEGSFFQVHRATLVNIEKVRFLERKEKGKSLLHLQDVPDPLTVSRRLAVQLRHRLKTMRQP